MGYICTEQKTKEQELSTNDRQSGKLYTVQLIYLNVVFQRLLGNYSHFNLSWHSG